MADSYRVTTAHTAALRTILMTYHQYSPTLGYVQGMSDLLSPIYVVYDADEASSFWAFVGWMKVMVSAVPGGSFCTAPASFRLCRKKTFPATKVA